MPKMTIFSISMADIMQRQEQKKLLEIKCLEQSGVSGILAQGLSAHMMAKFFESCSSKTDIGCNLRGAHASVLFCFIVDVMKMLEKTIMKI